MWSFAIVATFLLLLSPSAQDARGQRADADRDAVTATDVNGATHSGRLQALSADRLAIISDTARQPRELSTSDLLTLRFDHRQPRFPADAAVVFLANGDRLVARPVRMEEIQAVAEWVGFPDSPPLNLPLETVRGFVLSVPRTDSARTTLFQTVLDRREKSDVLVLNNGDRVTGELVGFDSDSLAIEAAVGETEIKRDGVHTVGFNADLISFPKIEGKHALLTLTDGSRITVRNPSLNKNGEIGFEAAYGEKLSLPLSAVVSLQFFGGRAVYLSDLEPAEYRFTPYLATKWELRADRNVAGGPLRLGGVEYAKGLGMHSNSEVTYELGGNYRRFHALVGIDDAAGGQGSVICAVDVDGKRVFTSGHVTGTTPPRPIGPIDLTGARRITLIVDFGQFGDILDHANWCDAVLVR